VSRRPTLHDSGAREDWETALALLFVATHGCTDVEDGGDGKGFTLAESLKVATGWPEERVRVALMEMQARGMTEGPLGAEGSA